MKLFQKDDRTRIFLCHASEDKPVAEELYFKLKKEGLNPWLDKLNLLPGQDWDIEIRKAIKSSIFILVLLSKTSVSKRGYVQREFKLALDVIDEIPDGKICVIPVRLDNCDIPERFRKLHYCNLFDKNGFVSIIKSIKTESKLSGKYLFRSQPKNNLTEQQVIRFLKEYDLFDNELNFTGKGIEHNFEVFESDGISLIRDRVTGLIWQQTMDNRFDIFKTEEISDVETYGPPAPLTAEEFAALISKTFVEREDAFWVDDVEGYIAILNDKKYGGFNDWRIPTLEEGMSLMIPRGHFEKSIENDYFNSAKEFYIDDNKTFFFTSDKLNGLLWTVFFFAGSCQPNDKAFIRAVRSDS